jgi:hypothetical protein
VRTWTRARAWQVCGNCGDVVPVGEPLLLIELKTTVLERCEACAGPAPPELPAWVERGGQVEVDARWSALVPSPLARAKPLPLPLEPEREPGEEG